AAGNHDHIVILDRKRLIDAAVVGVDALEGEALWGIETVVVGFLERALQRQIIGIVLVRRIARRVPAGRNDFDDEQTISRLRLGKDVADQALTEPFSACEALHRAWLEQARRMMAAARRAGDGNLRGGMRNDGGAVGARQIDGVGRALLEHADALADVAPALTV